MRKRCTYVTCRITCPSLPTSSTGVLGKMCFVFEAFHKYLTICRAPDKIGYKG